MHSTGIGSVLLVVSVLAGCGSRPAAPSPAPAPIPLTVTNTVTGAPILDFTAVVNGSRRIVSAPGYITRDTSASVTATDLIPEAGFDLGFYRQLVRGALNGSMEPLRRLTASPSIYLQTAGLSPAMVSSMEAAARAVVPALTGGALSVAGWETGEAAKVPQAGWIVISTDHEVPGECGRSTIAGGDIHISTRPNCVDSGYAATNLAHELGHALGFRHVPSGLMAAPAPRGVTLPSEPERYHGAIAYKRPNGSRDIDVD